MLLLQKHIDETGAETLSQSDKLFVVHVKQNKDSKERAWSAGGPVLPSLQLALARYPHTIVELEVDSHVLLLACTNATHKQQPCIKPCGNQALAYICKHCNAGQ